MTCRGVFRELSNTQAWHFKGAYIEVSFENVILKPDMGVDKNQSIFQVWIILRQPV